VPIQAFFEAASNSDPKGSVFQVEIPSWSVSTLSGGTSLQPKALSKR
jgi:hypothetical protein